MRKLSITLIQEGALSFRGSVPEEISQEILLIKKKKKKKQVILSAQRPLIFNSTLPQYTLQMFADHFMAQDKPYHEKPLIRDCCNYKG